MQSWPSIVSALSSIITLLCVHLRRSRIKEVVVCGECLKIKNSPSGKLSTQESISVP